MSWGPPFALHSSAAIYDCTIPSILLARLPRMQAVLGSGISTGRQDGPVHRKLCVCELRAAQWRAGGGGDGALQPRLPPLRGVLQRAHAVVRLGPCAKLPRKPRPGSESPWCEPHAPHYNLKSQTRAPNDETELLSHNTDLSACEARNTECALVQHLKSQCPVRSYPAVPSPNVEEFILTLGHVVSTLEKCRVFTSSPHFCSFCLLGRLGVTVEDAQLAFDAAVANGGEGVQPPTTLTDEATGTQQV